ncbi:hypothetical protein [Photobacterium ganghwense]|uniref:hypothetical protein n=1 Tax=Photobacterium ganghwense TaxID=320778 RepID=UPI001C2D5AD2|nr:hypothetical protein [Photobacterium ganghwense]MBV1842298.1 hypothetical protein [Photobacterium ganghwense]
MSRQPSEALLEAIHTIYHAFPNLSYRPRPDDVKLLAAYMKSRDNNYPSQLDLLLQENNQHIEHELQRYHSKQKSVSRSPLLDS